MIRIRSLLRPTVGLKIGFLTTTILCVLTGAVLYLAVEATTGSETAAEHRVALDKLSDAFDLAQQIADTSQAVAAAATTQAATLQKINESLRDMSKLTASSNQCVEHANAASADSSRSTDAGHRHVESLVVAMQEIKDASSEITMVVKTIDDIAFQTNLLALNAAVEAARAGEHGRGFAVVAEEVRNFSKRIADSAKNTAVMIENSASKAQAGADISSRVSGAFDEIATSTLKPDSLFTDVQNSTVEQTVGINQIIEAVHRLETISKSNVEQSHQLANRVIDTVTALHSLGELVQAFQVDSE